MLLRTVTLFNKGSTCLNCRILAPTRRFYGQELVKAYTDEQKEKILEVMNRSDDQVLLSYDITKSKVKKLAQWKFTYGQLKTLEEVELIEGLTDKYAKKLFDSILKGPIKKVEKKVTNKIRGQVLQPTLSESVRQKCNTVLSLYVSVNSVCWTLINRNNYEVVEWDYCSIDYPEAKKLQITDIVQIALKVTRRLPQADLYLMKGEATTLRASGSDPNNPKMLSVNLQKSQLIAMIVALVNARANPLDVSREDGVTNAIDNKDTVFKHKVYFLRPTLPFRLFGTLVGNEKVSTDQTVELLLQNIDDNPDTKEERCVPIISDVLKSKFRSQNELERDMLGHCMLLALTFMDLCIYKKQESIDKLVNRRED